MPKNPNFLDGVLKFIIHHHLGKIQEKNDEIFNKINHEILELILNKHFKLSQFDYFDTDYSKIIDELKWRHYIIFNICISLIKLKKII